MLSRDKMFLIVDVLFCPEHLGCYVKSIYGFLSRVLVLFCQEYLYCSVQLWCSAELVWGEGRSLRDARLGWDQAWDLTVLSTLW